MTLFPGYLHLRQAGSFWQKIGLVGWNADKYNILAKLLPRCTSSMSVIDRFTAQSRKSGQSLGQAR